MNFAIHFFRIMFSNLVVTTTVVNGTLNCLFDVESIYLYLPIDDYIVKLKCNNKERVNNLDIDSTKECVTFYNQISITLKNKTNIKLFNNGGFQMSGIKSLEEAKSKLNIILDIIKNIKGTTLATCDVYRGIYVYNNKLIKREIEGVSNGRYVSYNLIKNNNIIIDTFTCEMFSLLENTFIQVSHVEKKKQIYNIFCENIGYAEYIMNKKGKNLCVKDCNYYILPTTSINLEFIIINKFKNEIGKMIVYLNKEIPEPLANHNISILYYACSEIKDCRYYHVPEPKILTIKTSNINSNFKVILNKTQFIDREALCVYFNKNSIQYDYMPCTYPGIILKRPSVKFIIFRTGSVLCSSKESIDDDTMWLQDIFTNNRELFVKSKISNTTVETSEKLSIWDLL